MHLTFGTGLFWLLLASTVGETIVRTARAMRRGRDDASGSAASGPAALDDPARHDPPLERRIAELERVVVQLVDVQHGQDATIDRLREQVDFAERLLGARQQERALR